MTPSGASLDAGLMADGRSRPAGRVRAESQAGPLAGAAAGNRRRRGAPLPHRARCRAGRAEEAAPDSTPAIAAGPRPVWRGTGPHSRSQPNSNPIPPRKGVNSSVASKHSHWNLRDC